MISKTQVSKRQERKRNPELIEIINLAKKNNLLDLAKRLSGPRSQYKSVNLEELEVVEEDRILVVGKVLGSGNISRKLHIAALGFSKQAKEKLKKSGGEVISIKEALTKNNKLEGVKII